MPLSSTQIGALAENLVANELMIESQGRLAAFQPVADDDGIDVLFYDKITGNACPIQIKARTNTLKSAGLKRGGLPFISRLEKLPSIKTETLSYYASFSARIFDTQSVPG